MIYKLLEEIRKCEGSSDDMTCDSVEHHSGAIIRSIVAQNT